MTKVYFAINDQEWSQETLHQMLLPLPADMQNKIVAYKSWKERQARIIGKHMLIKLLKDFDLDLTLADMLYSPANKPYFNTNFHFSTAHSADMIICAADIAPIGIDIEFIASIELQDYRQYLTDKEWLYIQNTKDKINAFYEIWTKKEALLKALGIGLDLELNTLDVSTNKAIHNNQSFNFYPLNLTDNFIAHISSLFPIDTDQLKMEEFAYTV
jgi:4'-phosphopantetheinyl transferase